MAWRVLSHQGETWHVHVAAERRPNTVAWQLVFSFRRPPSAGGEAFWAPYPLESPSKSSLFAQAERIPNDALAALLIERDVGA